MSSTASSLSEIQDPKSDNCSDMVFSSFSMEAVLMKLGVCEPRISAASESPGGDLSSRERLYLLTIVPGLICSKLTALGSLKSGLKTPILISGREAAFVALVDELPGDAVGELAGEVGDPAGGPSSCFSGVSGMKPLQYSFLPKFNFPWIVSMRSLLVALSIFLMVTTPLFFMIISSFFSSGSPLLQATQ